MGDTKKKTVCNNTFCSLDYVTSKQSDNLKLISPEQGRYYGNCSYSAFPYPAVPRLHGHQVGSRHISRNEIIEKSLSEKLIFNILYRIGT